MAKTNVEPCRYAGVANVERFETVPNVVAATPAAAPLRMVRRSIRDTVVGLVSLTLDSIGSSIRLNEPVATPNEVG